MTLKFGQAKPKLKWVKNDMISSGTSHFELHILNQKDELNLQLDCESKSELHLENRFHEFVIVATYWKYDFHKLKVQKMMT